MALLTIKETSDVLGMSLKSVETESLLPGDVDL